MQDEMEIKTGIHLGEVFKKSLAVYYEHFPQFVSLSLIYTILGLLIRISLKKVLGDNAQVLSITVMLNMLILCRMGAVLIYMASKRILNEAIDVQKAFFETKGLYRTYLMVYSSVFLLMGIGFFLFIVPGFYIGAMLLFSDVLVILEKKSFKEAFSRSRELAKKHFGVVLLFLLIIIFISIFPVILFKFFGATHFNMVKSFSDVFSALFIPFYMISQVQLYYKIKEYKDVEIV